MSRSSSLLMMVGLCISFIFAAENSATKGIPWRDNGFDRNLLLRDTTQEEMSPFSLEQSYTLSYWSTPWGNQTQGVYLTTLRYQFEVPLELSADIGIYHLFSRSRKNDPPSRHRDPQTPDADILFPRIGLEYHPTSNSYITLQIFNAEDASRAYAPFETWGYGYYDHERNHRYPFRP